MSGGSNRPFLVSWNTDPLLLGMLLLSAFAYALAWRHLQRSGRRTPPNRQLVAFAGGMFSLTVALLGPFDTFNDDLFLVHMLQHVTLMLVAAPLLVLGRPVQLALQAIPPRHSGPVVRTVLRKRWVRTTLSALTNAGVVFLLFNVNLVVWHVPAIYTAALRNNTLHLAEHIAFFSTSLLFWWVIIDPIPRHHRLESHLAILLLFTTGAVGELLGLALTLAPRVLYPFYAGTTNPWGLTPLADQHLSGLIMLVSGTLVYFGAIFWFLSQGVQPQPNADDLRA
jgi:cytochrome c oxidase assembly factor CtaG